MTNLTYKYVPLYKTYSDILAKLRISKARINNTATSMPTFWKIYFLYIA